MCAVLDEIDELINKFSGEQREEVADFYIQQSREKLDGRSVMGRKEIQLLKHVTRYMVKQDREELTDQIINTKVIQARTFILDSLKDDFSEEKEFFSKSSKWAVAIVEDIRQTFDLSKDRDVRLFQIFNDRLCEEIVLIFCSREKFNSSGNQLLLDLLMYGNSFRDVISFDFNSLVDRIRRNFNPGKALKTSEIQEIYAKIQK